MNNVKVWPHLVLVAVVCAVAAGVGVGLWMKHERTTSAEALPNAARIQRVDGEVALDNSDAGNAQSDQWIAATANQPVSVGDRIYTRDNSRASLAFTGRNFARLNPNTSLDVLALNDRRTQLALRDGSAVFDVGYLNPNDLFEVATPYGAVDFQQPGLYDVGINNGQVLVSVLSGLAQVVGLGGSGQISKGELLTLVGSTAADVVLSQLNGRDAGYLVDDYYGYQYPQYYDGRYRDYNAYLNDPYYFDPYRRTVSYQYANSYIPGLYDLDYYGDWRNIDGYGYAWAPRVDSGWMPYQTGYWYTDYPYGPTWVSTEPWGYAPYHYGRWAYVGDRWYWVPDRVNVEPVYSPALVAFVPFDQNQIGWVPLAPGDVYVPHYYNTTWQPYYLSRDNLYERTVNLNVPGAVTVVNVDDFDRGIDWRRTRKADRNMLAQVNPVLDPLLVTPLRNAVVHSAWGRGKIDIPPGIAKKLNDTTVVTSTAPVAPPFRPDLAKTMRVNNAPDRAKGQKFQVRDERRGREAPPQTAQAPARVQPQQQQPVEQQRGRGQEQREARRVEQQQRVQQRVEQKARVETPREARRVEQQQRVQQRVQQREQPRVQQPEQPRVERRASAPQAERPARPAQQQPRGERVAAPARPAPAPARAQPQPQPKHERPPQAQAPQQQKQERAPKGGPPASPGGGKGKGKKP
ncbi:MAG TPA: FecR family protein [Pyrinomonadaceae bacterium]